MTLVVGYAAAIIGFLVGLGVASAAKNAEWRDKCTCRGVARYHPVTGKWEWTVGEKDERSGEES